MDRRAPSTPSWPIELIACPLAAHDAAGAIRELGARLAVAPGVLDGAALIEAIETRERQATTYLGGGIAMPHARTTAVDRLVVAVGLSPNGLAWSSPRELARLVFLVGVPREEVRGYLEMVRRITQAVRRIDWIEQAVACRDAAELAQHLRDTIEL
ncbi:MAG: PTS sugar transporter subunit IIA [Opitutaceae bacterium]|nr:PTS sugar transporter subunit IIA [Opitutaceae bacterium]